MHQNAATLGTSEKTMPIRRPTLSVIVPVYNEERILKEQALRLIAYAQQLTKEVEVLFVENGSKDKTLDILKELQKRFSLIRIIRSRKADYSTAVIEGIKTAEGKYSIVTGIDYVDLEVLRRCLHALEDSDIVICSKNKGLDRRSFSNRLVNRCYNTFAKLFFKLEYSDIEGYHGYDTKKIQAIVADVETKAHLCNLWVLVRAHKAGLRVNEVPIVVYERRRSRFMKSTRLPYLAAISLAEFIKLKCKGY